ncbi:MORC family CW-type zinc finger protein 3-like isoform X2 [Scleropages formosus]|uniref:MORC family CW-type zinc finger protein 3-like isoform X2 n=1 Tax=Scleropages formosus TaxID=113540 RepID=UPI0008783056|nr:MORC family CW-type zinc finger protein 3-like isoform X2 [Scleropages formosus]
MSRFEGSLEDRGRLERTGEDQGEEDRRAMEVRRCRGIPLSAVSPKFLHTNSTSHTWPFSAIAELIDVMAKQLWIDWTRIKGIDCLTFQDNGSGMTQRKMYKMLSFGFSDKQKVKRHIPVGVYGNGFKSGSMRLGKDAIVFSKTTESMSVGLLSQTYLETIRAQQVVVPIVTFRRVGQNQAEDVASLQDILRYSLFNTESELFSELRAINATSGSTGTRIIIWNLRRITNGETEFDFNTDRYDIQIKANTCHGHDKYKRQDSTMQTVPESDYSLRAYCSILYLKPRMQIIIRGQKVKTQLISKSLAHIAKDHYRPTFLSNRIRITFGYNTKSKEQYGIMMYHKNRLIKAYERVGCQRKADGRGVGVIGVIECNFLQPTHNKQDFDNTDKYRKTVYNLGLKLEEYWNEIRYKCKKENPTCTIPIEDTTKFPDQTWVQCDKCLKWRRLPDGINYRGLPEQWFCHMNPDPQFRSCKAEEEPEDSDDDQRSYPKPYKRQRRNSKIQKEDKKQQVLAPVLPPSTTPLSDNEVWRPLVDALTAYSSPHSTNPAYTGCSTSRNSMPIISGSTLSATLERVKKKLAMHSAVDACVETDGTAAPPLSLPFLRKQILATTQMNTKTPQRETEWREEVEEDITEYDQEKYWQEEQCEDKEEERVAKATELYLEEAETMEIKANAWEEVQQQQQDQLMELMQTTAQERDTYKEQVHQLQQEVKEIKHRCEYLEVIRRERNELKSRCEQMKRELEHMKRQRVTMMQNSDMTLNLDQGTQNGMEENCRKLRSLRCTIGRLLVTFVPTLDLDQIDFDGDVIDGVLEQVVNEVTSPNDADFI